MIGIIQWQEMAATAFRKRWDYPGNGTRSRKRGKAERWLAHKLGISKDQCEIALFDIDTCKKVVAVCLAAGTKY